MMEKRLDNSSTNGQIPIYISFGVVLMMLMALLFAFSLAPRYEYEIISDSSALAVGESVSVNIVRYKIQGDEKICEEIPENTSVKWNVSDDNILCFNPIDSAQNNSISVNAISSGLCTLSARIGSTVTSVNFEVVLPATGIKFSSDSLLLEVEDSYTFDYDILPEGAGITENVSYSSDNEDIATVDNDGNITPIRPGIVHITAQADGLSSTASVVIYAKLRGVELVPQDIELVGEGASQQLEFRYIPEFTTDIKPYEIVIEDENVATLDENGTVSINCPGDTVIVANCGDYSVSCNVHTSLPMTGISIQNNYTIPLGSSSRLFVTYMPEKTEDDKTTVYSSSDDNIVKIDSYGNMTAMNVGNATISVSCNGFIETTNVRVNIPVTAVVLNKTSLNLQTGGQDNLTVAILPENTTEATNVTWTSSNPGVATVTGGVVKAVSAGKATITASCGGVSASCEVSVTSPPPAPVYYGGGGGRVVVLDPGHDSVHTGAFYNGVAEQNATMTVALACKAYLESTYGVTVYLTRSGPGPLNPDRESCLISRCQVAQNVGAACLVSLHFNASGSHNVSGASVIVSTHANVSGASSALGSSILNQLCGLGLSNKGLIRRQSASKINADGTPMDYYSITRNCALRGIPAVIVEHCYLDVDAGFVTNPAMLNQLGVADAIGIAHYLGL